MDFLDVPWGFPLLYFVDLGVLHLDLTLPDSYSEELDGWLLELALLDVEEQVMFFEDGEHFLY